MQNKTTQDLLGIVKPHCIQPLQRGKQSRYQATIPLYLSKLANNHFCGNLDIL